jgi:hypothetical protein
MQGMTRAHAHRQCGHARSPVHTHPHHQQHHDHKHAHAPGSASGMHRRSQAAIASLVCAVGLSGGTLLRASDDALARDLRCFLPDAPFRSGVRTIADSVGADVGASDVTRGAGVACSSGSADIDANSTRCCCCAADTRAVGTSRISPADAYRRGSDADMPRAAGVDGELADVIASASLTNIVARDAAGDAASAADGRARRLRLFVDATATSVFASSATASVLASAASDLGDSCTGTRSMDTIDVAVAEVVVTVNAAIDSASVRAGGGVVIVTGAGGAFARSKGCLVATSSCTLTVLSSFIAFACVVVASALFVSIVGKSGLLSLFSSNAVVD